MSTVRPPFAQYGVFEIIGPPIAGAPIVPLIDLPLWSPDELAGAICWYTPDAGVTVGTSSTGQNGIIAVNAVTSNGTSVGPNLTHNEGTVMQVAAAAFPSGVPALLLTGNGGFVSTALGESPLPYIQDATKPFTFAFSAKRLAATGQFDQVSIFFGQGDFGADNTNGIRVRFDGGVPGLTFTMGGSSGLVARTTSAIAAGEAFVAIITYDGSGHTAGVNFYLNGVADTTVSVNDPGPGSAVNAGVVGSREFYLGHLLNENNLAELGELFGCDHVMNATEIANATAYLRARFGI